MGGVVGALALFDLTRLRLPALNPTFLTACRRLVSLREAEGVASSTWYALGVFRAVLLAPLELAVSAILVLGLADPAGSRVGTRWGRRPFLGGTGEGTLAFAIVAGAILTLRHDPAVAVVVALVAALTELRSWPLTDRQPRGSRGLRGAAHGAGRLRGGGRAADSRKHRQCGS